LYLSCTSGSHVAYLTTFTPTLTQKYSYTCFSSSSSPPTPFGTGSRVTLLVLVSFDPLFLNITNLYQHKKIEKQDDINYEVDSNFCPICKITRPPQSRHCQHCGGCVPYFDHHCPFVASCIGVKNQRHFIMFLLYLTLAAVYAHWMSFTPFWECYLHADTFGQEKRCLFLGKNRLMYIPTFWGTFPILSMLGWQLYVAWTSVTTREVIRHFRKDSLGTILRLMMRWLLNGKLDNIYNIFGDNVISFFFFPWTSTLNRREKEMLKQLPKKV